MISNYTHKIVENILDFNIWKSFTEKQLISISNYYMVLFMISQGFSNKEINQITNITLDSITTWKNNHRIPYAVRVLEEFEERYSKVYLEDDILILSYLVGYNLGDGNISRNFCNTWFYGVDTDLARMKELFYFYDVNPVIYTYKIDDSKMAVHDRIFSRLLFCLGSVSGDKTTSSFLVPSWIFNSNNRNIKIRFLQGLFDSELCKLTQIRENSYSHLSFFQSKRIDLVNDGIIYLNQIRELLFEFGIKSSEIKLDKKYLRKRDSSTMQEICFYLFSNSINLNNFITHIGFLYNSKRKFLIKLHCENIRKNSMNEIKKLELYPQILKMRKQGISVSKIASMTGLSISSVKYWSSGKGKPRLFKYVNSS